MTRLFRLVTELRRLGEDLHSPECWEAADRLERAEWACNAVRRYIAIRQGMADVAPSWPDLRALGQYVADVPPAMTETQDPPAEAAQEVEA